MSISAQRLKWGLKWLLGKSRGGRNFGIFPDDVFVVSFPKSGNTWMRFLIANLITPNDPATFANIERKIPDVYKNTRNQLGRVARPRILKAHEYFDPRYKRVIYIVRDPRDVVVSYHKFHRKIRLIPDDYPMDGYVSRFVAGELDEFGSWYENVASWLATRHGTENFLLLRYEDLLRQSSCELSKIAIFLGLPRSPSDITRAIKLSSSDRMRELEQRQADQWINTRNTRKEIAFIGAATSGGWKSKLAPALQEKIFSAWGPLMSKLGYTTDGVKVPSVHSEPLELQILPTFFGAKGSAPPEAHSRDRTTVSA